VGLEDILKDGRELVESVKADPEKYEALLGKSQDAIGKIQSFVSSLRFGDTKAAESRLTAWEDVNRTLKALAAVEAENTKGPGVQVADVMAVAKVVGELIGVAARVALAL
jgi:hypothetical protein